ncbi:hypothetical protein ABTN38_19545, partial [Acinetobacter baumannii]
FSFEQGYRVLPGCSPILRFGFARPMSELCKPCDRDRSWSSALGHQRLFVFQYPAYAQGLEGGLASINGARAETIF